VKEAAASTSGGIFIPDSAKERATEGTVVAAGPGRINLETGAKLEMALKIGDGVIYGKYDGTELKYNEVAHQMIKDDDVLLRYTGGDPLLANTEPVKDMVLVRLPPREVSNTAGIIMTTGMEEERKNEWGTVAKVGPGRQAANGILIPILLQPGDCVRFRDAAGSDVKLEGVNYKVVRATEISCKWTA
jgi:chaperonin GroES